VERQRVGLDHLNAVINRTLSTDLINRLPNISFTIYDKKIKPKVAAFICDTWVSFQLHA